ncbi:MAG: NAD(P)-binding protein [Gemmatimonas sp.]
MTRSDDRKKTRVAILGGGVGAISAAFALTSPDNPAHEEYEVTIYQMGWRLGGKGASGRNGRFHQRIEEHGLHIWMGWYHNAFRLIKECYGERGRDPSRPLARWQEAFRPHSLVTLMDWHNASWKRWDMCFPQTPDEPGNRYASVAGHLQMLRGWMGAARNVMRESPQTGSQFLLDAFGTRTLGGMVFTGLPELLYFLRAISADQRVGAARCRRVRSHAARLRERVRAVIDHGAYDADDTFRRLTEMLDLMCTVVIGLIDEGVATGARTFNALDELELREFLRKHGCHQRALECAFLRTYYNLALAYSGGDSTDPANENAAAGVAINIMLRGCVGYRGAFMWEMQSGMGDTIFAPYYEVLLKRGVKFEFFHRVRELGLSSDGRRVQTIEIERQVDLRGPRYDPLIDVNGLACWPSTPRYEQLVQGEQLRAGGNTFNLESNNSQWTPVGAVTLHAGRDFDTVVLGIPTMSVPICTPLAQHSASWRNMIAGVETVATQAFQLWLRPSVEALGWRPSTSPEQHSGRSVLGAYAQPFHTWADFSHLAASEDWPEWMRPHTVAYFLGTIPAPFEASAQPTSAEGNSLYVQRESTRWMTSSARALWPRFVDANGALAWDLLVDPGERDGEARLDSQYHRANTEGSERYVQHTAGTTKHRLKAGESGFENLVLAGDWTDTGICGGCVETATMSGLQASRAISGYPEMVLGELR